jgi:hypothetical protein
MNCIRDFIEYTEEIVNKISFQNPKSRPYIILTFEPSEELKQMIKDNHYTYGIIPKEFVPKGVDANCFIMFDNLRLSFSDTKEEFA